MGHIHRPRTLFNLTCENAFGRHVFGRHVRLLGALLFGALLLGSPWLTGSAEATKPKKGKKPAAASAAKPKKPPPMTAAHKKALGDQMGPYKFGMSKDDILSILAKQIDETYAEQIKATSDVYTQDKLRREKGEELDRVRKSYQAFEGKKTGWDVSLIEDQFMHNTGESMLVLWENQGGKNQRRFFFFWEGKLYKMFLSLDTSLLPEDKRNFESIRSVMTSLYGPGAIEPGRITWDTSGFTAQAIDRLREYDALCLVIWDKKQGQQLASLRKERAPAQKEMSGVVKSVLDSGDSKVPVDLNKGTVDQVINSTQKGTNR